MAEYYAVERTPEYLAHYGIRGMKWGVRRAIKSGNKEALEKHYKKAAKKLLKLSTHTNRRLMKAKYDQAKQNMISGGLGSAVLSGSGTFALNSHLSPKKAALYGLGAGAIGGIAGALASSKGIMSGRYLSDKGHNKAIKKRDAWQKEMRDAFKSTEYRRGSLNDMVSNGLKNSLSTYKGYGSLYVPLMKTSAPRHKSKRK